MVETVFVGNRLNDDLMSAILRGFTIDTQLSKDSGLANKHRVDIVRSRGRNAVYGYDIIALLYIQARHIERRPERF